MAQRAKVLKGQRGFALASIMLLLMLLLTLGVVATMYSVLDMKSTTHYRSGDQALFAAESAVLHALSTMNNVGVVDFQNDVVRRWDQLYGVGRKTVPGFSSVSYQATVAVDPSNPGAKGNIAATGFAPSEARRMLRVTVGKGAAGGPGAIYLANDSAASNFDGNAFRVDGNDHDMFDGPKCATDSEHGGGGDDNHGDDVHGDDGHGDDAHADDDHGDDVHADDDHGDDGHTEDDHGDDLHADDDHSDDGHAADDHGDDGHTEDDHGGDVHSEDDHSDDAHGADDHGDDAHADDGHGDDAHGDDDHGGDAQPNDGCNAAAGVATRNDRVTAGVVGSLSDQQKDNVQGLGFNANPLTPSVMTTGGPSASDLDRIISHILANPNVVTVNDNNINGNVQLGSVDSPQITHLTSGGEVRLNGNASGAGILVVDGAIDIRGSLDFVGWIIARNATTFSGNSTVLGSIWTGALNIRGGGSAIVDYCSACLTLADGIPGTISGNVPRTMKVIVWEEVL